MIDPRTIRRGLSYGWAVHIVDEQRLAVTSSTGVAALCGLPLTLLDPEAEPPTPECSTCERLAGFYYPYTSRSCA